MWKGTSSRILPYKKSCLVKEINIKENNAIVSRKGKKKLGDQ